jgi:hypothetical protein
MPDVLLLGKLFCWLPFYRVNLITVTIIRITTKSIIVIIIAYAVYLQPFAIIPFASFMDCRTNSVACCFAFKIQSSRTGSFVRSGVACLSALGISSLNFSSLSVCSFDLLNFASSVSFFSLK